MILTIFHRRVRVVLSFPPHEYWHDIVQVPTLNQSTTRLSTGPCLQICAANSMHSSTNSSPSRYAFTVMPTSLSSPTSKTRSTVRSWRSTLYFDTTSFPLTPTTPSMVLLNKYSFYSLVSYFPRLCTSARMCAKARFVWTLPWPHINRHKLLLRLHREATSCFLFLLPCTMTHTLRRVHRLQSRPFYWWLSVRTFPKRQYLIIVRHEVVHTFTY